MAQNLGFEVDEVVLPHGASITDGDADPAVALLDRPVGSLYLRTNGEVWQKSGTMPNGWTRLEAGSAVLPDYVVANDELVFVDDELVEA